MSPGSPSSVAALMARSMATQHMTFENTKCCRPPRVSQMPSSGSFQWAITKFTTRRRYSQYSASTAPPNFRKMWAESMISP